MKGFIVLIMTLSLTVSQIACASTEVSSILGKQLQLSNTKTKENVSLYKAWEITKGSSDIVVAVIDTGLNLKNPAFSHKDNLWVNKGETGVDTNGNRKESNGIDDDNNGYVDDVYGANTVKYDGDITDKHDTSHGTHIAGLIAGRDSKNNFFGIAPYVKIMPIKYFESPEFYHKPINNQLINVDCKKDTDKDGLNDCEDTDIDGDGVTNNKDLRPFDKRIKFLAKNPVEATINGIKYAIENGADIINYSGGGVDPSEEEKRMIKLAKEKGILVVAAGGNEKQNLNKDLRAASNSNGYININAKKAKGTYYPCMYEELHLDGKREIASSSCTKDTDLDGTKDCEDSDIDGDGIINENDIKPFDKNVKHVSDIDKGNIICVGSIDNDSNYASHSNVGENQIDFFAPGYQVISTMKEGYGSLTGTSQSTAIVSGIAALMLSVNRDLTPTEIKRILQRTVDVKEGYNILNKTSGKVNAYNAVRVSKMIKEKKEEIARQEKELIEKKILFERPNKIDNK